MEVGMGGGGFQEMIKAVVEKKNGMEDLNLGLSSNPISPLLSLRVVD